MAVVIDNAKLLEQARARVGFCFLCGCAFKNFSGTKPIGTQLEHVIPSGILGKGDASGPGPVPATLWVHPECEQSVKEKNDNVLAAFQRLHLDTVKPISLNRAKQVKHMFRNPAFDELGELVPVVDGEELLEACKSWLCGLHALLYGKFLPRRTDAFTIFAPCKSVVTHKNNGVTQITWNRNESHINFQEQSWSVVSRALKSGEEAGCLDSLVCWGGQLKFNAVWISATKRDARRGFRGLCMWMLDHPGSRELSRIIHGTNRTWHGLYRASVIPDNASRVEAFLN